MPVKNSLISNSISSPVFPPTLGKKALFTQKSVILKVRWVLEGGVIYLFKDYEVTQGKQQHASIQKVTSSTQLFHLLFSFTLHEAGKPPACSTCCQRSCLCTDKGQKATRFGRPRKQNVMQFNEHAWSHSEVTKTASSLQPRTGQIMEYFPHN